MGRRAAADVGVLDRVDVDRVPVGMLRPAARARRRAAVEGRGVVGLDRVEVAAAVVVDEAHAPDREAGVVEPPQDRHDRARRVGVDDQVARVGAPVEAAVADGELVDRGPGVVAERKADPRRLADAAERPQGPVTGGVGAIEAVAVRGAGRARGSRDALSGGVRVARSGSRTRIGALCSGRRRQDRERERAGCGQRGEAVHDRLLGLAIGNAIAAVAA